MKRSILSPAQATWLETTMARNRRLFGGWSMEDDGGDDTGGSDKDQGGTGSDSGDDDGGQQDDKGFPPNTPVAEMTVEQRAAYWEHQSKKHEGRNRDLLKITGGKYGDELREQFDELGRLRTEHMSDGEKAVEQAKAEGRREASLALAPQMFDVALGHVDEDRRKVLIDSIDLSKVLNTDGTIDTDKVTTLASTIAPADKGQGSQRDPDYGGGKRRESGSTGVKSGVALYESRRKKSTTES